MKTLYSCGCSFMSSDLYDLGTKSFLDQYCEARGFKHVNLARSGATNFLIRLQIEEAIQRNADYIIISATGSDRIDFATKEAVPVLLKLENVEYQGYNSISEKLIRPNDVCVVSDSINNWTTKEAREIAHSNDKRNIDPGIITAMTHYVAHLHNFSLEQNKDYYIISDGLRKLIQLQKKFIFMGGPMFYLDWSWIGMKHLWTDPQPWDLPNGLDHVTINHTPQVAHDKFLQTLHNMTPDWN